MFTLINLPYSLDALEPVISKQTLEFHHGKHLHTYVDNLNKLIAGTEFESLCHSELPSCHSERSEESLLEEIIVISSGAKGGVEKSPSIFNNAGQILNHNLYFTQFRSFVADAPQDDKGCHSDFHCHSERSEESPLKTQIEKQWRSMEAFKAEFEAKGTGLFGSGWVWLAAKEDGELVILQCPGADNPLCHFERSPKDGVEKSLRPLLTFDVWEHAYYLDYQNRRAAHLSALWQIVDWDVIENRYESR